MSLAGGFLLEGTRLAIRRFNNIRRPVQFS